MTAFETVRYYPFTPNGLPGVTNQYALRVSDPVYFTHALRPNDAPMLFGE